MSKLRATTAILLTAALATAVATARAEEAPAATRAEIVSITQALMDALAPGKAEVWQRVLADDAVVVDEFGRKQDKAEAVKSVTGLPPGMSGSIELRDPLVHVYGDTAVIDCEAYEQETVFGQKLVVRYRFMNTYVRRDGAWKLVAMQDVTLPTAPPALAVRDLNLADYPGSYSYGPGRAFHVAVVDGKLGYSARAGGKFTPLDPLARDVFMQGDGERNLMIFRRDDAGRVVEVIERRKYNDLHMKREDAAEQ